MRRMMWLLVFLLSASFCFSQILIHPKPHAVGYLFFAGQPPRAVISTISNEENGKFQQVYTAVLQGNVTLDAEGDALSAQEDAYKKVLMAAMVKVDPKVAPALEASGKGLTSTQSEQIRQAQAAAMRADPKLPVEWDDLTKKMEKHRQEVDAAMLKLDPSVAPTLAKLSP